MSQKQIDIINQQAENQNQKQVQKIQDLIPQIIKQIQKQESSLNLKAIQS